MNRKSFLKLTARAGLFLGLAPSVIGCKSQDAIHKDQVNDFLLANKAAGTALNLTTEPISKVKVGMIGMGNRGSVLIQMFEYLIKNNHAEIVALSDLKEDKLNKNNEYLKTIQQKVSQLYFEFCPKNDHGIYRPHDHA